ncbi:hypothetical protein JOS77_02310 [Chromobacterium haemolyticum]|nr:hypothetical protein JOS77_02310 [Chromobacterium haemolyticum]
MAQRVDGDAAGEIDEFAAALVPYAGTQALDRDETGRAVIGDHDLVEIGARYSIAHLDGSLPALSSFLIRIMKSQAASRTGRDAGFIDDFMKFQ